MNKKLKTKIADSGIFLVCALSIAISAILCLVGVGCLLYGVHQLLAWLYGYQRWHDLHPLATVGHLVLSGAIVGWTYWLMEPNRSSK